MATHVRVAIVPSHRTPPASPFAFCRVQVSNERQEYMMECMLCGRGVSSQPVFTPKALGLGNMRRSMAGWGCGGDGGGGVERCVYVGGGLEREGGTRKRERKGARER